VLIDREREG